MMNSIVSKYLMGVVIGMCCMNVHADIIGKAYVFGFNIERITGIPEIQMEEYGCLYDISRDSFISLLQVGRNMQEYQDLNVRAKVIFNNDVYFIDRYGIVRNGVNYFSIDTKKFELLLTRKRKCPRREP